MDKTRTVSQKWLANELDLHFLALTKCTKGQSNRSILSKVIVLTNYKSTDRQSIIKYILLNLFFLIIKGVSEGKSDHISQKRVSDSSISARVSARTRTKGSQEDLEDTISNEERASQGGMFNFVFWLCKGK